MKAIYGSLNFDLFMVLPRPTARITNAAKLEFSSNDRSKNREAVMPSWAGMAAIRGASRQWTAAKRAPSFGVDCGAHLAEPLVVSLGVVQQGLRTPTGPSFANSCTDGIPGLIFVSVSTRRSTRQTALFFAAA
jgi:hypothetical protein